jgi:hypothetical protein
MARQSTPEQEQQDFSESVPVFHISILIRRRLALRPDAKLAAVMRHSEQIQKSVVIAVFVEAGIGCVCVRMSGGCS